MLPHATGFHAYQDAPQCLWRAQLRAEARCRPRFLGSAHYPLPPRGQQRDRKSNPAACHLTKQGEIRLDAKPAPWNDTASPQAQDQPTPYRFPCLAAALGSGPTFSIRQSAGLGATQPTADRIEAGSRRRPLFVRNLLAYIIGQDTVGRRIAHMRFTPLWTHHPMPRDGKTPAAWHERAC